MFAKIFKSRSLNRFSSSADKASCNERSPPQKDKEQALPRSSSGGRRQEVRKKASTEDGAKKSNKGQVLPFLSHDVSESREPILFRQEDLQAMTGNFKTLAGKGGFGSVFKGHVLDSGTPKKVAVAVKVLHSEQLDLEEDLMREVVAVAQLQHPNILKLIGYCNRGEKKALVYDYIGGGDVDELLRKCQEGTRHFPWEQRLDVALGCAKALVYIHDQNFVHRDFKSSNVLLAEDLSPRVADFGLVKFIHDWHSHCTTRVKGSIGYIDPMYFTIGHVHTKSDVYAFGVFLVELISGKSVHRDQIHETVIPELTRDKVTEALVCQILDPTIPQDKVTIQQAKVLGELARRSLQDHWESRPNMRDLVQKINRLKNTASPEKAS